MEILNVGPGWSMTTKCVGYGRNGGGCGSTLRLSIDDVCMNTYTDYGGGTDTDYYYICPVCGVCNTLDYCSLPHNVTEAASVKFHRNRR